MCEAFFLWLMIILIQAIAISIRWFLDHLSLAN